MPSPFFLTAPFTRQDLVYHMAAMHAGSGSTIDKMEHWTKAKLVAVHNQAHESKADGG